MKGYGMGNKDHMADRAKRLAARYPDRVPPEPTTHVVVDGELFVFGDKSVEVEVVVPDEPDGTECPCGLETCVESWEPGCGLGESEEHAKLADPQPDTGNPVSAPDEKKKGGRPKGSKNKAKD